MKRPRHHHLPRSTNTRPHNHSSSSGGLRQPASRSDFQHLGALKIKSFLAKRTDQKTLEPQVDAKTSKRKGPTRNRTGVARMSYIAFEGDVDQNRK